VSASLPPRAARKHAARRRGWAAAVALAFWLFGAAVVLGVAAAFEAVLYGTRSPYQAHAAGGALAALAAAILAFVLVRRAARLRRASRLAGPGAPLMAPAAPATPAGAGAAGAPRSPALAEAERSALERAVAQAFPELRRKAP